MTDAPLTPRFVFLLSILPIFLTFSFGRVGNPSALLPLSSSPVQLDSTPAPVFMELGITPAILEAGYLSLDYPSKIKANVEGDIIRLTFELDDQFLLMTPTVNPGDEPSGNLQVKNLYDTHTVTAEARVDLAGVDVQPPGSLRAPFPSGGTVDFLWYIRPRETGLYRGTVWLYLIFTDRISGEESRLAVSAQIMEMEAVDFFGLPVQTVRTSGVIGAFAGLILLFPFWGEILEIFRAKKNREA